MSDATVRPTPEEHLNRLSRQAEGLRAQLELFLGSSRTDRPEDVLTGLQQISQLLLMVKDEVKRGEEERRNLLALAEIGRMVNSSLDIESVLREVMDTIIRLTGAERAFLMLRSPSGEMENRIARNWEHESVADDERRISRTVVEWVANHGSAILTTNAMDDPRFSSHSSVVAYNLRSILCVPLKVKDELIGVIYADSRVQNALFSDDDRTLLTLFAHQAAVALENARLYQALAAAYDQTLEALASALDTRDRDTQGHSRRVVQYAMRIAREIGLPEDQWPDLQRGALLHDIGKIGVPDAILRKPGPLDDDEWKIMRRHPAYGRDMLDGIPFLQAPCQVVYAHQERYDGSGYPQGLVGEDIPLGARIFAVADAFDAITSDRPYRNAADIEEARARIRQASGAQFDPRVVEAFLRVPVADWEGERNNPNDEAEDRSSTLASEG